MGLLSTLRTLGSYERAIEAADVQAAFTGTVDPANYPIASPWSSGDLQRIVFEDIFGADVALNTRSAAMRIPAIARGRNLIVSSIAQMRLAAMRGDQPVETPSWMLASPGGQSPQHRMAWTVDDLIFYGWSCHWRENGSSNGSTKFPLTMQRINQGDWEINADNRVLVNGEEVRNDQVKLISGFHEGLLSFGRDTLQDARTLYQVVRDRLNSPIPPIDLHQTGGDKLSNDEVDELIDRWVAARRAGKAVGYSSENIEVNVLQAGDDNLLIEARNAASLDLARIIGITANMVDATTPKSTLNYETTTGRNEEFVDRDLLLYMTPIVAQLSQDDVMPHGQRAVFDTSNFVQLDHAPTGPALED